MIVTIIFTKTKERGDAIDARPEGTTELKAAFLKERDDSFIILFPGTSVTKLTPPSSTQTVESVPMKDVHWANDDKFLSTNLLNLLTP